MRYSNLTLLFISALLFSLSSCFVPQSIVQMQSNGQGDVTWNYGQEIVSTQMDGLEAKVYFDDYTKDYLVFDVEITNWNEEAILVTPSQFFIETEMGQQFRSLNPERQILSQKIEASQQEARQKNGAVVLGVAAVATVVAVAVAADDDCTSDSGDDDWLVDDLVCVSTPVVPLVPTVAMPPSIEFWEDYALRITTLQPKYKVTGKVVFPRLDREKFLTLNLPVKEKTLKVGFNQTVIQP